MKRVGLIGWRGMVGSVLMQRMREEKDFDVIEPVFFTTSQAGQSGPDVGKAVPALKDAKDIDELKSMDIIITCQGGDYTKEVYPKLRDAGWQGDVRLARFGYTATSVSTRFAKRFRATCKRRLIVPSGASNSSLISNSD